MDKIKQKVIEKILKEFKQTYRNFGDVDYEHYATKIIQELKEEYKEEVKKMIEELWKNVDIDDPIIGDGKDADFNKGWVDGYQYFKEEALKELENL